MEFVLGDETVELIFLILISTKCIVGLILKIFLRASPLVSH